jgi:methylated-DNA-[protein]-cysteine S-methyltransferase
MTPLPDHLLEAIASEAVREGLVDAVFTRMPSPIGTLLVVQGPEGVVSVGFAGPADRSSFGEDASLARVAAMLGPRVVVSDAELSKTRDILSEYLEGESDELPSLPVDLSLARGPFHRAALEALHDTVAHGQTVTYTELARRAGSPRAIRAAGTACATNPIPLIVPCHRVLPATGRVGNYGLGGPEIKTRLLALEGALLA